LAAGDIIQIGPFVVTVSLNDDDLTLSVNREVGTRSTTRNLPQIDAIMANRVKKEEADVLKVFWEKRTRDREDWGTLLRPTEQPQPGKAIINWKPTGDLRRPWRPGLFVWSFLIVGAIAVFAYFQLPETFAEKPLATPHSAKIENSLIAQRSNGNSCTTCHMPDQPLENACISCHEAEQFHASNTKAHQSAGLTCTVCHAEHQGSDFNMKEAAVMTCAACHNDNNTKLYNGKAVHTAHGGSFGYPAIDGVWKWKGVYREVADAIPEINASATGDRDEQAKLSRHFHSVHLARLNVPEGLKGDSRGLVSCSTCHNNFNPIDRQTPRQTCTVCHTNSTGTQRDQRFAGSSVNCISCHVQHPYSGGRWSEFLTDEALLRRREAVSAHIGQTGNK
ncbi:MAG: hypothetical protein ABI539_14720, partial [Acidobacteriota bacterium]